MKNSIAFWYQNKIIDDSQRDQNGRENRGADHNDSQSRSNIDNVLQPLPQSLGLKKFI